MLCFAGAVVTAAATAAGSAARSGMAVPGEAPQLGWLALGPCLWVAAQPRNITAAPGQRAMAAVRRRCSEEVQLVGMCS